jgi:dihydrofolate reductase
MRKIFLHMFVSADGFIESEDKSLDWMVVDVEVEDYINGMLGSVDTMILGRKAFEVLADYWPSAAENPSEAADPARPEPHIEAAHMMNAKRKMVFSRTLKETSWANSTILGGDLAQEVANLKRQPGRDVALFGGAAIANSMMRLGLLDEYRLLINPVMLGAGTPLFQGGRGGSTLQLVGSRSFDCGAVLVSYRPK